MITTEQKEARRQLFIEATTDGRYDKWVAKAIKIIKGYYWTIDTDGLGIEIVDTLALKIIGGERMQEWDLKTPNLDQIMYKDIRGDIYNLHEREARKVGNAEESDEEKKGRIVLEEAYSSTNEQVNSEYENKEAIEIMEKELEGDDLCMEIFLGVLANDFDFKDDKEISEKLERDIKLIRAAKKRYRLHSNNAVAKIETIKLKENKL